MKTKETYICIRFEHHQDKFPDAEIFDYRDQHHKCHAASAFYNSGFNDAIAVVVDANGSKTKDGIEIETIFDIPSWQVASIRNTGHPKIRGYR